MTPDAAFRNEVRAFLAAHLKPEWRGVSELPSRPNPRATRAWQRVLAEHGWLTTGWPAKYGGRQLSAVEKYIFNAETAMARAPLIPHMEFGMVAPLIIAFGSEAQQEAYLPRILSGEDTWAQGFSEPGAGSDLASLRTAARRDGGEYVVTGQKIWTTNAHLATQLFCLVRTDPAASRPQRGISMLLIAMDLPGITVRPIRTIDGHHHFNEVFLDDVRVPARCLLGDENKGWDYAKALLQNERQGIAEVQPTRVILADVAGVAAAEPRGTGSMLDEQDFGRRLAQLEIELDSLETLELRVMERAALGSERGYEASLLKLLGSRLRQDILALGLEALGPVAEFRPGNGVPQHPSGLGAHFVSDALFYRAATIYGGSSEVQRNIVAKLLLASNTGI